MLGCIGGACFLTAFLLMAGAIRQAGVGITTALARLAVAVPVVGSILVWGEMPKHLQSVGLLLAIIGTICPVTPRKSRFTRPGTPPATWILPVTLMLVSGLAQLLLKAFAQWGSRGGSPTFLAIVFGSAGVGNLVLAACSRDKWGAGDVALGVALGLANVLSNLALLTALESLPGTLVFPVTSVGSILLGALTAVWFWNERYGLFHLVGMGVSGVSILLITLGG